MADKLYGLFDDSHRKNTLGSALTLSSCLELRPKVDISDVGSSNKERRLNRDRRTGHLYWEGEPEARPETDRCHYIVYSSLEPMN